MEDSAARETCRVDGDDDRIATHMEQNCEAKSEPEADEDEADKPCEEGYRRSSDLRESKRVRKSRSSADNETTEELVLTGRTDPCKDSCSASSRSDSSSAERYDMICIYF